MGLKGLKFRVFYLLCNPNTLTPQHPFALTSSPLPLRPSLFALTSSPLPLRPSPFALTSSPFPLRPYLFALTSSPLPLRPYLFALTSSPFASLIPSPCLVLIVNIVCIHYKNASAMACNNYHIVSWMDNKIMYIFIWQVAKYLVRSAPG